MIRINLLPPELRPQPRVRPLRVLALLGLFMLAIGAVGGLVWALTYRQSLVRDIQVITQKRIEYGPLYDKVIGMEVTLAEIEKKLAGRQKLVASLLDPSATMRAMEGLVPESVSYSSFAVNTDRKVSIAGRASDYYAVAALQLRLSLSEQYGEVVLGGARRGSSDAGVTFNMTCLLRRGGVSP